MTGTVDDVITMARSQLGVMESPPNSNNVKYNTWYYNGPVSGSSYPWCMVFCQWIYAMCHVKLPSDTASCTAMMNAAKKEGCFVTKDFQPGDLLLFDFKGQRNAPQHCGICMGELIDKTIKSIEGNTSYGNDTNGGAVMERTRKKSQIVGAVRPRFAKEDSMTPDEWIKSLTDKQAYELLEKARRHAATLPNPKWSVDEGWMAIAEQKKILTGKPEDLLKRDEFIAVLGRMGLL